MEYVIEVGSEHAMERVEEEQEDGSIKIEYHPLDGKHITTLRIPDIGVYDLETTAGFAEALRDCMGALREHIQPGTKPAWIVGSHPQLVFTLLESYGLDVAEHSEKPVDWPEEVAA